MTDEDNESGFVSHLTELRKRLIHSFIFLFIFFIGCYFFAEHIYGFLVEPFAKAVKDDGSERRLIFTLTHPLNHLTPFPLEPLNIREKKASQNGFQ